jgi:hypothetical protein
MNGRMIATSGAKAFERSSALKAVLVMPGWRAVAVTPVPLSRTASTRWAPPPRTGSTSCAGACAARARRDAPRAGCVGWSSSTGPGDPRAPGARRSSPVPRRARGWSVPEGGRRSARGPHPACRADWPGVGESVARARRARHRGKRRTRRVSCCRLIPYAAAAAVTDSSLETTLRTATRCFDMRPTVTHVATHLTRIT